MRRATFWFIFATVLLDMLALGIIAPVLGALSDRVGRRPVILVSCLGLGIDYAVMALAALLLVTAMVVVGRELGRATDAWQVERSEAT